MYGSIESGLDGSTTELLENFLAFGSLTSGLSDLVNLAVYICTALGFYTIAQRRGISKPWIAWIPVAQLWILGSISDQYQQIINRKTTKRRRLLILLEVLIAVVTIILVILALGAFVDVVMEGFEDIESIDFWMSVLGNLGGALLVVLAIAAVSIALAILQYMALYDVYRSCDPKNATLFLILSIFINIAQPICLMLCRNKDEGMPQAEPTPVSEPWNL